MNTYWALKILKLSHHIEQYITYQISITLLISAKSGARGKANAKMVMKPNWITKIFESLIYIEWENIIYITTSKLVYTQNI